MDPSNEEREKEERRPREKEWRTSSRDRYRVNTTGQRARAYATRHNLHDRVGVRQLADKDRREDSGRKIDRREERKGRGRGRRADVVERVRCRTMAQAQE